MADTLTDKLAAYGIDYVDAMDRMDNSEDLYKTLALKYLDNDNYAELIAAMDVGNYDDAYKAAHSLKGVSGNLSFKKIFDVSAAVSTALFQGEYQAAAEMLPDLKAAHDQVIDGLTAWSDGSL